MKNEFVNESQKSKDMELMYQKSSDPWGNGERKLYESLLGGTVDKLMNHLSINSPIVWCDLGCGGGNVTRGFKKFLDAYTENVEFRGVDISETAVSRLQEEGLYSNVLVCDLETITDTSDVLWKDADVISLIEVIYYLGNMRPWKLSMDIVWSHVKKGAYVIVADGLIPYQYRDYLASKSDAELVESFTETSCPVCKEVRDNGTSWSRYLKVRIYKKL